MPAFIDDGYTIPSVIGAQPDLGIEAVEFVFRPATLREYRRWIEDRHRGVIDPEHSPDAKFLAAHLVSWNLKYPGKSELVPITPANCDRLHPNVSSPMVNQIAGDMAPGKQIEPAKGN